MTQSDPSRATCKSPEQALAWKLEHDVGLSPASIRVVLILFLDHQQEYWSEDRAPGAIVFSAVARGEPAGKPLKHCRLVPVRLSVYLDSDGP